MQGENTTVFYKRDASIEKFKVLHNDKTKAVAAEMKLSKARFKNSRLPQAETPDQAMGKIRKSLKSLLKIHA